jgi:N-acetylglucosamine kinase-like BadF-type ATPase
MRFIWENGCPDESRPVAGSLIPLGYAADNLDKAVARRSIMRRMNTRPSVVVGIDGGGTHSFGVAVARDGQVRASAQAGSLNFFGSGLDRARHSLQQLLQSLQQALPASTEFTSIVVGCAALFDEASAEERASLCQGIAPLERTRVVSDATTAYEGATLGQPGVLVISGTGSFVLGRSETGRSAHVGGWGHFLGDEGSAYWIAREAARAAIAATEGRGPSTSLVQWVARWFEVKALSEIIPILHSPAFTKERLASLSHFLAQQQEPEDEVFRQICSQAGRELAAQAFTVIKRIETKLSPVPVYLVGGVVENNTRVRQSLLQALNETVSISARPAQLPPVLGAAALALTGSGTALTPPIVAALKQQANTLPAGDSSAA